VILQTDVKTTVDGDLRLLKKTSLVRQVDENPFLPVLHSVKELDLQICSRTAQRRLHEANVHCYHPARKIPLTNRHRDNRVAFALH